MKIATNYLVMWKPTERYATVSQMKVVGAFSTTGTETEAWRWLRDDIDRGEYDKHGPGTFALIRQRPRRELILTQSAIDDRRDAAETSAVTAGRYA